VEEAVLLAGTEEGGEDGVAVKDPEAPQLIPKAGFARPLLTMSMYPTPDHICSFILIPTWAR